MAQATDSLTTILHERPWSLQARVPLRLARRLQVEAARRGVHTRDLVIPALEEYLDKIEREPNELLQG